MSGEYGVIPVADYKGICDAVREKTHTDALMLPPEVAAKIRSINPTPTPGEWVRPEGWPDLDAVDLTGFDGVYLTYDLTKTEGYGWIGLFAKTSGQASWTVERGHLEAGQFVAERTEQIANGEYFREPLDDTYGTIQLWRVSTSGHITELKFVPLTATSASNMNNNLQPCVERVGRLPYAGNFSSGLGTVQTNRCWGTLWMQHDKLLDASSVTILSSAWQNCYSLQSLDLSGWDVSSVTSLRDAWNSCYSLQSLNLSGWDVSSVTTLQSAWAYCYNLQSLNLSGWDVPSVTNMTSAWNSCYNLQSLNLSGWDTGSVTTLQAAWQNCSSLQSLNLSGWDVTSVTNMSAAWQNCYSLQSLDLSGWDVTSVTNMSSAWQNCYSLQSLDLSGWDTGSVTSMANAWQNCSSLQSLNLSGWDVSGLSTNVAYPNGYMLTDYWPSVISVNQNYSGATSLSIASLLRIISSLPVVAEARTLTLGQTNKLKLTAEQIAVATQKGWTVA